MRAERNRMVIQGRSMVPRDGKVPVPRIWRDEKQEEGATRFVCA